MANDIQLRAYQLFRAALEKPRAEREDLIAARAASEPEVVAAAIRMLRDFEEGADREPGEAVILPEWASAREGSLVGDWRIEEHLQPGGFGRVYRAWRPAPGGKEEAAIKFLDIAPSEVPRFLRERQTLADLDHEGICKFIDGGTTSGGVPYLVMEYVAGLPITRYCDYHRMTITERLKLFVKLCQAVEYAHQHRVLHRDLKPANIFVTAARAVRVLDFGVAKLLDTGQGGGERLTKPGDAPWTKAYASPEQIEGGDLSFATDVYALGVVLYELVTGQLPFSRFALSGRDWMCVIAKREPLPPSQALLIEESDATSGTPPRIPETAAQFRGGSPSRLKRMLTGNLDAVILKALRKNPRERYARVDRLRSDIERFLDGLPVTARRSSLWERAWTWSSRHRFAAAVAVAWTLWLVLTLHVGFLRDSRYRAELRAQEDAMRRLRYLAGVGLPRIEKALRPDPEGGEARLVAAQIHTRLLQRIEALPDYTLTTVDSSLAASALECGRLWRDLGDPRAALAVTTRVLPRIARRYESDRRDRQWRELYSNLLRQRIELQTLLRQTTEASDGARLLAEIETRHY
jgi:serine/threonine protein kinase